jgi:hypothetical protein
VWEYVLVSRLCSKTMDDNEAGNSNEGRRRPARRAIRMHRLDVGADVGFGVSLKIHNVVQCAEPTYCATEQSQKDCSSDVTRSIFAITTAPGPGHASPESRATPSIVRSDHQGEQRRSLATRQYLDPLTKCQWGHPDPRRSIGCRCASTFTSAAPQRHMREAECATNSIPSLRVAFRTFCDARR